jgi:predicted AAA+ superfamily ATPase
MVRLRYDRAFSWFENIVKRQVKAPNVYVADSGLLHCLLDIHTRHDQTNATDYC